MPARNRMWAQQQPAIRRARSLRAVLSLRAIAAAPAADGIRLSHEGVKNYCVALQTAHFEVQRCTTISGAEGYRRMSLAPHCALSIGDRSADCARPRARRLAESLIRQATRRLVVEEIDDISAVVNRRRAGERH